MEIRAGIKNDILRLKFTFNLLWSAQEEQFVLFSFSTHSCDICIGIVVEVFNVRVGINFLTKKKE